MAKYRQPSEHFVNNLPAADVSFDAEAFDQLLRSQGSKMVHYRAQRCPVGLVDLGDIRRPHPHHENCSNGFIYTKIGTITTFLSGNSKNKRPEEVGFVDHSSVQASFPTAYDDLETPFIVAPFDRFYLDEPVNVVMWELYQHSQSGLDRLKYPVEAVEGDIIDSRGERYKLDQDFKVCNGVVEWIGRRPADELNMGPGLGNGFGTDRGVVCSVRYLYRPYWYVGSIPHEIRLSQIQNEVTGERTVTRMPQACVLHREYVSLNQDAVDQDQPIDTNAESLRRVMGPMYGGFGAK
jgi:hypothetical protein